MEFQLQTQVSGNNEFIDLFPDETITLDLSFAEIQDITKKNSAFTKDFNVPGSKNNNYIFDYFFDFNSVPLNWKPQKKFEAQILYNGYIIISGYIRLNNVVIDKTEKTYNITFYNGVGDVAANIGDKFLSDLDLSHLNHPWNDDVWTMSQADWNLNPLTSNGNNYSYQTGQVYWAPFNIGYNYVPSLSAISVYYLTTSTTSVSITSGSKTITTAAPLTPFIIGDTIRLTNTASGNYIQGVVTSAAGSTITFLPNLGLGTGTYALWTVSRQLLEGESIPDPQTTPILDFQPYNIPNYFTFSGTPITQYYYKPAIQLKELYTQIFNQADYLVESDFFDTNYFERFYLPLKFNSETIYNQATTTLCFDYNQGQFTPLQLSSDSIIQSAVTCASTAITYNLTGFSIPSSYSSSTDTYFANISGIYYAPEDPTCTTPGPLDFSIMFGSAYTDSTIVYQLFPFCNDLGPSSDYSFNATFPITNFDVLQGLYFSANNAPNIYSFNFQLIAPQVIAGQYDYAAEFPDNDYKQIDFITSVNKMFNLVVVPHPSKQKTLIVEPVIDYIGKGAILDWTDKINWDAPIALNPTTNILNGTLDYTFKLDKDYGNQNFNIANNRVFGTQKVLLNQDYKDNVVSFAGMFASSTDIGMNNTTKPAMTITNMAALKNENIKGTPFLKYNPYRILPRVIFRGLVVPVLNYGLPETSSGAEQWWWSEADNNTNIYFRYWQENSRFTTYPFYFSGFSHYVNYQSSDTTDNIQLNFPNAYNLYDIYYSDYVNDIISEDNKILSAQIYLTPWEIADLRFDEKIIIKNSYYRINRITGFNLTEPSLCNIELVKLILDYEPHPIKFFDLINCTGGTDYHTNTDLNFNMFAYVGNYVNIFTGATTAYTSIGCFEVREGSFSANTTYEQIFISSGFTNTSVGLYDDCGCANETAFDIVQQT